MEACPKCNFALAPETVECPACGVILAKLKAVSAPQRQLRSVPASVPSNPYAPPTAEIGDPPPPPPLPPAAAPVQDVITRPTVEALEAARPWIRFLSIYGFVGMSIMLIGAVGLLLFAMDKPQTIPIAIFYFLYGAIGFALLLPLHRSSTAIGRLGSLGASACLERFAKEQSAFWRLSGVIGVVTLVIVALGVAMALLAGSMLTGS